MAAVRCAARRLGGSALLRRTQAEERRRLVPSSLMHTSEQAPADLAREIQQKKEELYEVMVKSEKRFISTTPQDKQILCHLIDQVTPRPHDFHWRMIRFFKRATSAIEKASMLALTYMVGAAAIDYKDDYLGGKKEVARTVNKENQ